MQSTKNKIALVTGANTGVGFQIAKALSENNYIVFIGARDLEKGRTASSHLSENVIAIELDITKQDTIANAVKEINQKFGKLDLLVNNAGISHAGKPGRTLEEITTLQRASIANINEIRTVWDTNVFGTLAVTQSFLPLLLNASAARIVTVSSAVGSLTLNSNPATPHRSGFDAIYGASKTALNGIFLSLAIELESTNIKVHLVSPGFTATALNNFQGTDTVEEGSVEPIRVALAEDMPTGSFTGPSNFAGAGNNLPW